MTNPIAPSWLIVTGDLSTTGGQDAANLHLARYLARTDDVTVVTHRVDPSVTLPDRVRVHLVARPLGATVLGEPLLRRAGRRIVEGHGSDGPRVIANGGCLASTDVNWVHLVHAAHEPIAVGGPLRRAKSAWFHRRCVDAERRALEAAHLVVCNSDRTAKNVIERVGVAPGKVHVVRLGIDPVAFGPVTPDERAEARRTLGFDARPVALFVGTLGDRNKGFDTLYRAWLALCRDPAWDANLAVVGAGADRAFWEREARRDGLSGRVRFLGFRRDVPRLLAASDVLVHPARYEAFGLVVLEALCRGVPALVSHEAGVSEVVPQGLADLVLPGGVSEGPLVERLRGWRRDASATADRVRVAGEALRSYTWDHMAQALRALILANPVGR